VQQRAVPYFVMEYLSGRSLAKVLGEVRTLDAARVGAIIAQAASALAAAHAAGVVHRDLKPDNVFLVRNGERDFVKLLDFGVAKIAGAGRLTRAGMVYGTPHYMSPEQASGSVVDHRSDIYALGIIMYECFAGHVPFEADTYMGVLTKHMFATPEPIERVVTDPGCLGSLAPIIMRCLEKRPDDRFANMNEVSQAIHGALEGQGAPPSARHAQARGRDRLRLREPEPEPAPRRAVSAGAPRAVAQAPVWPYGLAAFVVVLLAGVGVWRFVAPAPQAHPAPGEATAAPAAELAPPTAAPTAVPSETAAPAPPTAAAPPGSATAAPPTATAAAKKPPAAVKKPAGPGTAATATSRRPAGDVVDPW
jgi:eukaryotic-like serine/threonine-protein kinase